MPEDSPSISRPDRVPVALAAEQQPSRVSNASRRWRNIIRRTRQERTARHHTDRTARIKKPEGKLLHKLVLFDQLRRIADYFIRATTPSAESPTAQRAQRRAGRRLIQNAVRSYLRPTPRSSRSKK